jgi:hypothetical protein
MPDKPKTEPRRSTTQSGSFPRPKFLDSEPRQEAPPPPSHPPEYFDGGATTGKMPVVTEGQDKSAERDNDRAAGV